MVLAPALHIVLLLHAVPAMSDGTWRSAIDEVARIWARYGVVIESHVDPSAPVPVGTTVIDVKASAPLPPVRGSSRPLGFIDFRGAHPMPAIALNHEGLVQMVRGLAILGRRERQWSRAFRDEIVGRALGRVLAHEIGHFVLASKRHSRGGLMRADHVIYDLVDASDHLYGLDDAAYARAKARTLTVTPMGPAR